MSQPVKQSAKDGIKDKLKGLFTNKSKDENEHSVSVQPDVVLSHQVSSQCAKHIKNLRSDHDFDRRMTSLAYVEKNVITQSMVEGTLEIILLSIRDLVVPARFDNPYERILQFLVVLCQNQHALLGASREVVFHLIKSCPLERTDLIEPKIAALGVLTNSGREVKRLEMDLVPTLVGWIPYVLNVATPVNRHPGYSHPVNDPPAVSTANSKDVDLRAAATVYLRFVANLIKFNASCFDDDHVRVLIREVCIYACRTPASGDVKECLTMLENTIKYSCVPACGNSLLLLTTTLCKLVNQELRCKDAWKLMKILLATHQGHSTVIIMLRMLEDAVNYPDEFVLRGCVFFVGISLWGAERVPTLKHNPSSVLPAYIMALEKRSIMVTYEVLRQIDRLVKKFSGDIHPISWDVIIKLMSKVYEIHDRDPSDSPIHTLFHDILSVVEQLYAQNMFIGSADQLFNLIDRTSKYRPEMSILNLLSYKTKGISPTKTQWLGSLRGLVHEYYTRHAEPTVRIAALRVLKSVYLDNRYLYAELLTERVILPLCEGIERESNFEIMALFTNVLIDVAKDMRGKQFFEIGLVLCRLANYRLEALGDANVASASSDSGDSGQMPVVAIAHREEFYEYLSFLPILTCGVLEIFRAKWPTSHAGQGIMIYEQLNRHVALIYARDLSICYENAGARMDIFEFLLNFRSNSKFEIGIPGDSKADQLIFSPYITCSESQQAPGSYSHSSSLATGGDSPPLSPGPLANVASSNSVGGTMQSTGAHSVVKTHILSYRLAFESLTAAIGKERSWPVLKLILTEIPALLTSRNLMLSHPEGVTQLTYALLVLLNDQKRVDVLINKPERFTLADLKEFVYPPLSGLVIYRDLFQEDLQRKLAMGIQEGLISQNSTRCVLATINCVLEMQSVITPMMRDLVKRLSEIKSVPNIAIPLIELCSAIAEFPDLYLIDFRNKDYAHIFEIILPFIDTFRFTTFIVAFAVDVLLKWFTKSPVNFRPSLAAYSMNFLTKIIQSREYQASVNDGKKEINNILDSSNSNQLQSNILVAVENFFVLHMCSNSPVKETQQHISNFLLKDSESKTWLFHDHLITIRISKPPILSKKVCRNCLCFLLPPGILSPLGAFSPNFDRHFVETPLPTGPQKLSYSNGCQEPAEAEVSNLASTDGLNYPRHFSTPVGGNSNHPDSAQVSTDDRSSRPREDKGDLTGLHENVFADVRRRHQSAIQRSVTRPPTVSAQPCFDDSCIVSSPFITGLRSSTAHQLNYRMMMNRHNMFRPNLDSLAKSTQSTDEFGIANSFGGSYGLGARATSLNVPFGSFPLDGEVPDWPPNCACWSDGWAEVIVRQPFAKTSWMMEFATGSDSREILGHLARALGSNASNFDPTSKLGSYVNLTSASVDLATQNVVGLPNFEENNTLNYDGVSENSSRPSWYIPHTGSTGMDTPARSRAVRAASGRGRPLSGEARRNVGLAPVGSDENMADIGGAVRHWTISGSDHQSFARNAVLEKQKASANRISGSQLLQIDVNVQDGGEVNRSIRPVRPLSTDLSTSSTATSFYSSQSTQALPPPKTSPQTPKVMLSPAEGDSTSQANANNPDPSALFLQLFQDMRLSKIISSPPSNQPQLLQSTQEVERSIRQLDTTFQPMERISVGVLFAGDQQTSAKEIFSNQYGTARYIEFLKGIGHHICLSASDSSKFYLGGLETSGKDGKFTYYWSNPFKQVVYHVATEMPNRDNDPDCNQKKKHIGNDYVTIVWNHGDGDYDLSTITGQFSYVAIILQPADATTLSVTLKAKDEISRWLSFKHTVVSDRSAPILCRLMAQQAYLSSRVWKEHHYNKQEYISQAVERVTQIGRIKEKYSTNEKSKDNADSFSSFLW